MYLIGIDFGHGETTASYYDTENPNKGVQRLHILDGNKDEDSKVESAVCRDKQTGKWRFAVNADDYSSPDFSIQFKAPMDEITAGKKEAFSAFIRLVFEHILKNQDFLKYNPQTGEKNFRMYIACPSGWGKKEDDTQIQEYRKFVSGIIPVEWVIKESDAAYFKFKAEKNIPANSTVLVIDIGSSTIDFTYYGMKVNGADSSLSDGQKHGASMVERSICKYFKENDKDYQEAEKDASKYPKVKWLDAVTHYVKKQKEDFYTNMYNALGLDITNNTISPLLTKKRIFDAVSLEKEKLENEILADYKKLLIDDFKSVHNSLENVSEVILTGGASRMPWLRELTIQVFGSNVNIYKDEIPSYVVSDGIAAYAYAVYQLETQIKDAINKFWEKHNDETLRKLILDYFNESLQKIQLPMIKKICADFDAGNIVYNIDNFKEEEESLRNAFYNGRHCTIVFVPEMRKHNNRVLIDNGGKICREINNGMNALLAKDVVKSIKDCFTNNNLGDVTISIVPTVEIDLNTAISNEWDKKAIIELTKKIYADWLNEGDIFKDRNTREKRQKFTEEFYEMQKNAIVTPSKNMMDAAVASLKQSINAELTVEKMLEKCLFTIYK